MKLICELFKYKLIDKNLITYILENLTLDLKKNFKLELGVSLVQNLYKYINEEEKKKFIEFFSIYLKNPNLNKKIKFMILDFIETREVKTKGLIFVPINYFASFLGKYFFSKFVNLFKTK